MRLSVPGTQTKVAALDINNHPKDIIEEEGGVLHIVNKEVNEKLICEVLLSGLG